MAMSPPPIELLTPFERWSFSLMDRLQREVQPFGNLWLRHITQRWMDLGSSRMLIPVGIERIAAKAWSFTPNTAVWNATGQPACNVPMHWNADNLPIGVQFGVSMGGDGKSPARGAKMYLESPNDDAASTGVLEIRVPARARVWVKCGTADVEARGMEGGLDIAVIGGKVRVQSSPRELQIEAMDASVAIDGTPAWLRAKTATGDITLAEGKETNDHIAWSKKRGGTYMPTPIVYGDYLYTCSNNGVLTCYDAKSGERIYQQRAAGQSNAFSASPIAADGKLYLAGEDGDVFVVKAGKEYQLLATNPMGEVMMATPAISQGMLFIRTIGHVYGIADTSATKSKAAK